MNKSKIIIVQNKKYTQTEVETILCVFAEQHGLMSTKGEVDEISKWIKKRFKKK